MFRYELLIKIDLAHPPPRRLPSHSPAWKCYWDSSFDRPRRQWKILNRFRSERECCNEGKCRWNFCEPFLCHCVNEVNQSLSHILNYCPVRRFERGLAIQYFSEVIRNWDIGIYLTLHLMKQIKVLNKLPN